MLVGSTFAWFTDTATTAVNTIQAGTLKVDIVNESGTQTLITPKGRETFRLLMIG